MRPAPMRRLGALLVSLGLVGSMAVTPTLAASITVNALVDTTADDGLCTLREAIIAANTDTASGASVGECAAGSGADTITFGVAGTITLTAALPTIASDLSVTGAGAVTVSGAGVDRVFLITGGTVTLSGLTITGGATGSSGGGIFSNTALTVANSTISGNTAALGGGGIANLGTLTVTNSLISGNTATLGGGVFNNVGATATVTNSTISGNTAAGNDGGGISSFGTLTVSNSTISGNTAVGNDGGGISNLGGLTVTNSTINSNSAGAGGGIFNNATATVAGSTISGNTADGGGIFNGATLTITNSTIFGNTGSSLGGGILDTGVLTATNVTISGNTAGVSAGGIVGTGTETLVNAIVAGNTAPSGADVDFGVEPATTSVIGVPAGKTLADILDPAGLTDNGGPTQTIALALVAGNPAIDTATSAQCAAPPVSGVDQRGLARPAACDIGAYEAQPPTMAAHANVSAAATSAAGAVVSYTAPAGTDEQGGSAAVACVPASGSTFAVGSTTVTCTATDAVGHTATGTFQVIVSALAATPSPTPRLLPNTAANVTDATPGGLVMLGLLSLGFVAMGLAYGRDRRLRR